jgi:hypothetical protein
MYQLPPVSKAEGRSPPHASTAANASIQIPAALPLVQFSIRSPASLPLKQQIPPSTTPPTGGRFFQNSVEI